MKEEYIGWSELEILVEELADKIDYEPDVLIGIARGGLVPLRLLSNYFPKIPVGIIGINRYEEKDAGETRFYGELSIDVKDKNVLLIDDVCDKGVTLHEAKRCILNKGAKSIYSVTLHYKKSKFYKPNVYCKEVDSDIWINYPWHKKMTRVE